MGVMAPSQRMFVMARVYRLPLKIAIPAKKNQNAAPGFPVEAASSNAGVAWEPWAPGAPLALWAADASASRAMACSRW